MTLTKKYNLYKESNIPWLTEVPIDWEITALKRYYKIQLGKMLQPQPSSFTDVEVDYLKAIHVQWGNVQLENIPKMWATQLDLEKYNVKNGDLLICEGGEVGRSAILSGLKGECIIQNAIHRVEQTAQGLNKYLYYFMKHVANAGWFDILCNKATIAHLTSEKLSAIQMCCPSIIEQQKIADFLDYKTAQIDALIAKKETLLLKLQEKRSALITQAVTKGIHPNVTMKPSGVERLGDVPAHWDIKKLKFCLQINNGRDYKDVQADSGFPVYGSGGQFTFSNEYLHDGEAVLLGRKGTIDKPLYVNEAFWTVDTMYYGVPFKKYSGKFLFYCATCIPFNLYATDTALPSMTQTSLNNHKIAIPDFEEQKLVVEYIEEKTSFINLQIQRVNDVVQKLNEYRSALITSAVTGKIDVRDFNIPQKA